MTAFARLLRAASSISSLRASIVDAAHGDVLPRRHVVAHEVLEDDADLAVQIFDAVVAQIDTVEQDAPGGRIVLTRQQFHDRRLALSVGANQRDALAEPDTQVQPIEHQPVVPGIGERDVVEHDAVSTSGAVREWRRAWTGSSAAP